MVITEGICIYDNLLSLQEEESIFNKLNSEFFPWYKGPGDVTSEDYTKVNNTSVFEYLQFSHCFVNEGIQTSDDIEIIIPILDKVQRRLKQELHIYRAKANLQTKVQKKGKLYNIPHIDHESLSHDVILYYANNSDGCTYIFNNDKQPWVVEKQIESKQGRVVIFDGSKYHAGSHPEKDKRIVINFNVVKPM